MICLWDSYPALPIAAAIIVLLSGSSRYSFRHSVFRFIPVCERTGEPNGAARAKSDFFGAVTAVLGVCRSQELFDHPNHRKGIGLGHNRANADFMSVALQVGA